MIDNLKTKRILQSLNRIKIYLDGCSSVLEFPRLFVTVKLIDRICNGGGRVINPSFIVLRIGGAEFGCC
jgi:hypothetical protein